MYDITGLEKSALTGLDSLHIHTDPRSSCYYDNFIFTVKTSGIPRETDHQLSHVSCGPVTVMTTHVLTKSHLLQKVKPSQRELGVQTKKAVHSEAETSSSRESPPIPGRPGALAQSSDAADALQQGLATSHKRRHLSGDRCASRGTGCSPRKQGQTSQAHASAAE